MDQVYDYDRILQGILDVGEEMVCWCGWDWETILARS